jgi:hypothetical protein
MRRYLLEALAIFLETMRLFAAAATCVRSHRLVPLLLVDDFGSKGIGVAQFDIVHGRKTLSFMIAVICTFDTLATIAQVARRKALAVQLEAPRLLA